jgi:hypothetical protein
VSFLRFALNLTLKSYGNYDHTLKSDCFEATIPMITGKSGVAAVVAKRQCKAKVHRWRVFQS